MNRSTLVAPASSTADSPQRAQKLTRERRLMKVLQNPILGAALRQFVDPQDVLHLGMSFWSSRVLLTAVEFGVFTELAGKSLTAAELTQTLGWHTRAAAAFLDALVALGMLKRDRVGRYCN